MSPVAAQPEQPPPPPSRPASPVTRPRMRGWIHLWSFCVSIAAAAVLVPLAATVSALAAFSTAVYGLTVLGVFGVSALYHRRTWWNRRIFLRMKRLDHSMIFLFIAGTYTPFTLLGMSTPTGPIVLAIVWAGALLGVGVKLLWHQAPRAVGGVLYIGVGWVAVVALPELLATAGATVLVLVLTGGVLYTLGAIMFAARKPNPAPTVFGYHEIFHSCTVLAASCHYIAIWLTLYA